MRELIIVIDHFGHVELNDYLMGLDGILDVNIRYNKYLEIYVKYNSELITYKVIKMEILLFLNSLNMPSIIAFDKFSTTKLSEYTMLKNDICCEWCLKGAVEDLFEIEGIETVETNYNEDTYYEICHQKKDNIIINVKYNSELLSTEDMKIIESDLSL